MTGQAASHRPSEKVCRNDMYLQLWRQSHDLYGEGWYSSPTARSLCVGSDELLDSEPDPGTCRHLLSSAFGRIELPPVF